MGTTNKTVKAERITRHYIFEMRASKDDDEKGIIEGRAIVYDSETDLHYFREKISKGALDNTDLKDVAFLVNHNTDMIPLARSRNNNENSTMQLIVDDKGLKIRVKLDIENNSEARNLYSAIVRGDITGMSFMFTVRAEEWSDEDKEVSLRTITDIEKVFEVSAVTFPAYEDTEINARCKLELENFKRTLENVKNITLDSDGDNSNKRNNDDELELLKLKTKILGGM